MTLTGQEFLNLVFRKLLLFVHFLVIELFLGVRKQMKVINAFRFYVYRVISILKCNNLQSLKTILKKGAFCETKQNSVNLIWSADFWSIVLLQIRRDFSQLRLQIPRCLREQRSQNPRCLGEQRSQNPPSPNMPQKAMNNSAFLGLHEFFCIAQFKELF